MHAIRLDLRAGLTARHLRGHYRSPWLELRRCLPRKGPYILRRGCGGPKDAKKEQRDQERLGAVRCPRLSWGGRLAVGSVRVAKEGCADG